MKYTVVLIKPIYMQLLHTPTPDSLKPQKQSVDAPTTFHHLHEGKRHAYDVSQLLPMPKTKKHQL